jgi:predicted metal-dependent HD superfamily phosphohydrolase
MNYSQLRKEGELYARNLFAAAPAGRLIYHNLQHTERVVAAAGKIADHYSLGEKEYTAVIVAAWFHDTGYFVRAAGHEEVSRDYALEFLQQQDGGQELAALVSACIMATRMPQAPHSLPEQILCDADLYNLGTEDFVNTNKLLRKEVEVLRGTKISKDEWRSNTIRLLESHHYHTDYARLLLNDKKTENLEALKQKQEAPAAPTATPDKVDKPVATDSGEAPKKDKTRPDRGIETMFRISSNNNQRLSDMADNKAHIMITVNSIILSAIISLLLGKIPKQEYLAIPTYLILVISVTTIIFSILATRPSLPSGRFTPDDLKERKVNLLFFGNYYRMSLEDYAGGMWGMMEDKQFLYGSLIKDVYAQGVVLGRKYRLLRISYNIFMFGLIISVFAFVLASLIHAQ